jgi:DNA-directed RNA polymerase specialized sigma subunit
MPFRTSRVARLRKLKGLEQRDIATNAGISQGHVFCAVAVFDTGNRRLLLC